MKIIFIALFMILGSLAQADATSPVCTSNHQPLPVNNDQIIKFKSQTPNGYHDRGHVTGKVTQIFPDATNHNHFEITLLATPATTLEIIYQQSFGRLPDLQVGDSIEACGDYITSNDNFNGYKPSPDGAIIHWVHRGSGHEAHDDGYVMVNGVVFGGVR